MIDIQKFSDWARAGRRSVRVEIEQQRDCSVKVWCFDYSLMAGKHADIDGEPPTTEELKAVLRAELEERIAKLEEVPA
jgi:hypothetical protein